MGKQRWVGLVLSLLGVLVQFAAVAFVGEESVGLGFGILVLGALVLGVGLALYARSGGHSAAFCLAALIGVFGLVLVAAMGRRSAEPAAPTPARRAGLSVAAYGAALLVLSAVSIGLSGRFVGMNILGPVVMLCLGAWAARGSRAGVALATIVTGLCLCGGLVALVVILFGPSEPGAGVGAMRALAGGLFLLTAWSALNLVWLWRALRGARPEEADEAGAGTGSHRASGGLLIVVGVLVTIVVLYLACLGLGGRAGGAPPEQAAPAGLRWAAPDREACVDFARRVEHNVAWSDGSLLDRSMDLDVFAERTFAGLDLPPAVLDGVMAGFSSTMEFGGQMAALVRQ